MDLFLLRPCRSHIKINGKTPQRTKHKNRKSHWQSRTRINKEIKRDYLWYYIISYHYYSEIRRKTTWNIHSWCEEIHNIWQSKSVNSVKQRLKHLNIFNIAYYQRSNRTNISSNIRSSCKSVFWHHLKNSILTLNSTTNQRFHHEYHSQHR